MSLLYGFLAGLYILRYFVLGIFQRIPTQPSFSYLLKSLSLLLIAIGAGSGYIALVGLTVLGLSMISLRKWSRHSVEQYDGWIKKRAAHIYHRHKVVFMNYHIQTQYVGLLITVTEDIARPSFSRLMERLYFCVKKPKTITSGVMQVSAKKILSDRESIEKGLEIVEDLLRNKPHDLNHKEDLEYVASIYNGNKFYARFLESSEPGVHAYWKNERLSSL